MQWIDIGANLTHDSFDADREAVIARAAAAGVAQILVTGADLTSSQTAIGLAHTHPGQLFATAGVHPHHAEHFSEAQLPALRELVQLAAVVAVGECGLDYHRNFSAHSAQRRSFALQLRLAADCGKPVFLHQRDAHEDFVAMLAEYAPALSGGVAHCFTAGERELEAYLSLGLSIGITGWFCDERRGAHLAALVARIPAGRLMLETDAPYLLPRDLSPRPASRRNEPMYLPHIGAAVAAARGESSAACAAHTTAQVRALFQLPSPPAG